MADAAAQPRAAARRHPQLKGEHSEKARAGAPCESSWNDPTLRDHDRPLNERGLRDAPEMGRRLSERGVVPDAIVTSSAVRARSTAQLIARELGFDEKRIVTDPHLYAASPGEVLEAIRALNDDATCVPVFGHNPEFSELAHSFSSDIVHMPTCAVGEFEFDVGSWAKLGKVAPTRVRFDSPRSQGA